MKTKTGALSKSVGFPGTDMVMGKIKDRTTRIVTWSAKSKGVVPKLRTKITNKQMDKIMENFFIHELNKNETLDRKIK